VKNSVAVALRWLARMTMNNVMSTNSAKMPMFTHGLPVLDSAAT
jgi:hypothetical protein